MPTDDHPHISDIFDRHALERVVSIWGLSPVLACIQEWIEDEGAAHWIPDHHLYYGDPAEGEEPDTNIHYHKELHHEEQSTGRPTGIDPDRQATGQRPEDDRDTYPFGPVR